MIIVKNVSILGNFLGTKEDLEKAIQLQSKVRMGPIIDSEYLIEEVLDFVQQPFLIPFLEPSKIV